MGDVEALRRDVKEEWEFACCGYFDKDDEDVVLWIVFHNDKTVTLKNKADATLGVIQYSAFGDEGLEEVRKHLGRYKIGCDGHAAFILGDKLEQKKITCFGVRDTVGKCDAYVYGRKVANSLGWWATKAGRDYAVCPKCKTPDHYAELSFECNCDDCVHDESHYTQTKCGRCDCSGPQGKGKWNCMGGMIYCCSDTCGGDMICYECHDIICYNK